ncbi:MAG: hypothetical protein WCB31_07115 [Nitrososphaeraceae archaeon]
MTLSVFVITYLNDKTYFSLPIQIVQVLTPFLVTRGEGKPNTELANAFC